MKIIDDDVYLINLAFESIPDIFQGVVVNGDFSCSGNLLTSLEGAPKEVEGSFFYSNNNIHGRTGACSM